MKYIIIIFSCFCSFLYAENIENNFDSINNLFESANEFYNNGEYLQANYLYKDIVSSNIISKDLYYNLASSYLALGSNGYALLYYEKALNISPFDKEIKSAVKSITGKNNNKSMFIIIFYLFLIVFIIFSAYTFFIFMKKKKLNIFFIIIAITFLIPAIIINNYVNKDYIVSISETNIYSGSSTNSQVLSKVYEGDKFEILKEYEKWYYIKGISKGWIEKKSSDKI